MQQTTGIVVKHLSFLGVNTKQLGVLHGRKSNVYVMLFNVTLRRFRATIFFNTVIPRLTSDPANEFFG